MYHDSYFCLGDEHFLVLMCYHASAALILHMPHALIYQLDASAFVSVQAQC